MSEFTVMWETLDLNNFRVFLRDLSASTDINLKHMIEDYVKQEKKCPKNHNSKKAKMKKKDLIMYFSVLLHVAGCRLILIIQ